MGNSYWRGPIWININYLALRALHKHYVNADGPYQDKARRIYEELRMNLSRNVLQVYEQTGFFWEQYSAENGDGHRAHPFTGWTSLILLIMAEKY